jgi:ABC-type maltose transport system permease subunit
MIFYQGEFVVDTGTIMAAALMVSVPIIVLYLVVQKHFIAGVTTSGLKG